MRTICTRTHNSIQSGTSRHLDGHTNTETSFYYLHEQTKETDWKPSSGHLPHQHVFTGRSKISSVLSPHNLGPSFWKYISKYRESEVSMSDVYLFLVRASQINDYTSGVQSFKTMDTVSWGNIYYYWQGSIFYRVLMFKDWLIVEHFHQFDVSGPSQLEPKSRWRTFSH